MKLFGAIKELVSAVFRKDSNEITLRPNQSTTYTAARDIQFPPGNTDHVVVSATSTQTLTNKTFDADGTGNSITNIENADIKSGAAIDAAKLANGSVSNTEFQYIGGLTSDAQTQLNAKLDDFSSSNDNRVVRTDGTGGSAVQESPLILSDAGALSGITQLDADNVRIDGNTVSSTSGDLNLNAGANVVNLEAANVFLRAGADLSFYDNDNTNAITISVPADVTANRTPQIPDDTGNFVLTSATQTLTNKTLTSPAINTPTGITKADVGLSNVDNTSNATERAATATLTNKTLTAPILDDYFDVNEEAAPGTPASGKVRVYAKTDKKLYTKDSSGVEQEIGSGSSSGNVSFFFDDLENGSAANWTGYADAAAATPVDGTGGTATTLTVTASSSSPLREVYSLSVAKSAANGQGQGIAASVAIPSGYQQAAKRVIEFLWDGSGANYVAGDMACYVYDVTNSLLITPSVAALPAAKVPIQISWDSSSSASYRLIFHVASTNASAYTVKLDDITVGPGVIINAAPIGPWQSYTPTVTTISGFTIAPSGRWRQVGDSVEVRVGWRKNGSAGLGAAAVTISIPPGMTIDTTKIPGGGSTVAVLGSVSYFDTNYSALRLGSYSITNTDLVAGLPGTPGIMIGTSFAANSYFDLSATFPVAEFAGAPNYAGQNDVEWASSTTGTWDAAAAAVNTVYGPQGSPITSALTSDRDKVVRFQTPIQITDDIQLFLIDQNGKPTPFSSIIPTSLHPTFDFGPRIESISGQDVTVRFRQYAIPGTIYNTTTGAINWNTALGANKFWVLRKARAGAAVGFGHATTTQSGLVSTGTQSFAGEKTFVGATTLGSATTTTTKHVVQNIAPSAFALEVNNQSSTGRGLYVYANNSSTSHNALLVEGSTGERLSVRNDGLVNIPNLKAGVSYKIRNDPNMTSGVGINVLDFTGLPAGMYLVSGKRTGVSVGTNGLFWVGWTGTSGIHYTTIAANGLSAPTFSGTFFNVTSNSSTQHYFYAQTMTIDF